MTAVPMMSAKELVDFLQRYVDTCVERENNEISPIKPADHVPFHWPPPAISKEYHVVGSDWTDHASLEAYGQHFEVKLARTPYGVFGRLENIWNEAKGETVEEVIEALRRGAEPYFQRQVAIASTLGLEGRFEGKIRDLQPNQLLMVLYCSDRDVAHEALVEIETHASLFIFGPALIEILRDRRHRQRRSAQWCALDLFEDLPSFCPDKQQQHEAISAMKALIWDAEDDYARAIYKAGVVLGGHVCTEDAADALLECFEAPSRIGRRAAMHGSFHLAEWLPSRKGQVINSLRKAAKEDSEALLRDYCAALADDVERGEVDHVTDPTFADEA